MNWGTLREPRIGIMLHYDGSVTDAGAVDWLQRDPRCRVSYNWLVLDDGIEVSIAPADRRAWHAGLCRPSVRPLAYRDANSAFYGVAAATRAGVPVTPRQFAAIVSLCRTLFAQHHWDPREGWRIVGHDRECWPRGRKIDPTGPDPVHPVLSVAQLRAAVAA